MSELIIVGNLVKLLPLQSGVSKTSGKEWKSQEFIINIPGQYPKDACLSVFGDKIQYLSNLDAGDELTVKFSIESKEYKDKYFTKLNAYSIVKTVESGQNQTTGSQNNYSGVNLPPTEYATQDQIQDDGSDNLPF